MNDSAVDWIKRQYKDVVLSELGTMVVQFLDKMWGIHNCNKTSLGKVDWGNNTWIEVVIDKMMSTVDNNDLTRLVVIAHNMMLRVEMTGIGPGYVKLQFHQRSLRNLEMGRYWDWCPSIEDHIARINKMYEPIEKG